MSNTLVWLQLLALAAATDNSVTIQSLLYRPPMNGEPPAEVLNWLKAKLQESAGAEEGEDYFRSKESRLGNSILPQESSETLAPPQQSVHNQDVQFGSKLLHLPPSSPGTGDTLAQNSSATPITNDSDTHKSSDDDHENLTRVIIPIKDRAAEFGDNDIGNENSSSHNTLYLNVQHQDADRSRVTVKIGKALGLQPMHRKASQDSEAYVVNGEVTDVPLRSTGSQLKSMLQARRKDKAAKKAARLHQEETARQENISDEREDELQTEVFGVFQPSHRETDPYGQTYQYNIQDPITGTYRFGYAAPGQWRHEERRLNGVVLGRYGWQDALGHQHQTHFVADARGYRTVYPGQQITVYIPEKLEYDEERVKRPTFPLPHPHFLPVTGRPPIAYPLPERPPVTYRPGTYRPVTYRPNLRPVRPPSPLRPLHRIRPEPTASSFLPQQFKYRPISVVHTTTESVTSKGPINHLVSKISKSSIEDELFGLLTPPGLRSEANEAKTINVTSNDSINNQQNEKTTNGFLKLLDLFKGFQAVPIKDNNEAQNENVSQPI